MQKALARRLCILHSWGMRDHADIVSEVGARRLAEERHVSIHTAVSWRTRNSIPAEHWRAIADAGHASLDELATAAALRAGVIPQEIAA